MAPTKVNPDNVREFKDADAFYKWLGKHHDKEDEVWIKIHKVGSGLKSITPKEAIDVVLCWGWIDAIRKGFDDKSYLQRYTPRTQEKHLEPDQRRQRRAADRGRPDDRARVEGSRGGQGRRALGRAPTSGKDMKIPDDLQAAIDAEPKARAMLAKLSAQNRFALAFRTHNMKTEAGRKKKIEAFVAMLKRGETIYPQGKK